MARGKFVRLRPADGLPEIDPRSLFLDSRGWLWIGSRYKGVSMTKEPGVEDPKFINYSTEQGLSSGAVRAITEDDFGRLYFGTDKGLDRLDPQTGRWQHYTSKNGLAGDAIADLHKDRQGNIWVATSRGLSKFDPRAERPVTRPAPIYFSRVNVAGEDLPLPETGATQIPQVELSPSRNNLSIDYVALSFQGEDNLSYQYQLEGVEPDWSAPTKHRSINYGRLAAGTYRFLARAITEDGSRSLAPAVFEFRILPPVYQRWWFLTFAAFAVGMAAYALYRYRVSRLVEIERVRTRIAADLHDDIGANLTKIGILSEVVRQQMNNQDRRMADPISSIARISRESVGSMSDIVWAINPRRDSLRDLTRRMREFAGEIFANRDVEFELRAPSSDTYLKLGADVRRTVFLIFKEAVNNIVRHSDCNKANIDLGVEGSLLVLTVSDDGKGFDTTLEREGNGLVSMRNRAASMGGKVEIASRKPSGTRVTLCLPIKHSKSKLTMRAKGAIS